MRKRKLLSVIAAVMVLLGWLGARPAEARDILTWPDFEGRLSLCDIIKVEFQHNAVNINQIQFVLNAPAHSWKGVSVIDENNGSYNIDNGAGPSTMLVTTDTVRHAQSILFGKSGFAGTHNAVYEVQDLSNLQGGDRMTVTWVHDHCPDLQGFADLSSIPSFLKPGETLPFELRIFPRSGWSASQLLSIHFDASLGIPQFDIQQVATFNNPVRVPITITAPETEGETIKLNLWIAQRGGDAQGLGSHWIPVRKTAPPPKPPEPPKLVKVPDVRGMPLDKARAKLAAVSLGIAPQGRDPSLPEGAQTVVSQSPGMGSEVLRNVKINVGLSTPGSASPTGYSKLQIVNCSQTSTHLWEWTGSYWIKHGTIPSMWGDGSICPGSNPPVLHPIPHGQWRLYVVTDPLRCSTGNNPEDSACWAANVAVRGDSAGPVSPPLYH